MKIWQLRADMDNYSSFYSAIPFTGFELREFDGRSQIENRKILQVKKGDWKEDLELGDTPDYILPVFSERALRAVKSLIDEHVEALKLNYEEPYYAINVTTVLDAINYEDAEYVTFRDGKRIIRFTKYAFIPEKVKGIHIFKISDEKRGFPLVSDEFKEVIEKENLKGFKFRLLWDSEKSE